MGAVDSSLSFLKKSVTATMTHTSHPHFTKTLHLATPAERGAVEPSTAQQRESASHGQCQPRPFSIFQ